MKNFKIFTLLLCLVLIFSLFAGCGKANNNNENNTTDGKDTGEKEEVTLSVLLQLANSANINNESEMLVELARRTGVKLDWTATQRNPDVNQAIPLMTAGGDLPDIVAVTLNPMLNDMIVANAIYNLDDYIDEYGPNIVKNAGEGLALNRVTRSNGTGNLYTFPGGFGYKPYSATFADKGWSIRWDLYKELGYPKLETMDDLLDVMEDMMALEPTTADGKKTYGFGGFFGESWGYVMPGQSETNVWGDLLSGVVLYDLTTYTPRPQFETLDDPVFRSIEFWNKAYRRGILDPEALAMKFGDYQDTAKTGKYLATSLPWAGATSMNAIFVENGEPEKGFVQFIVGNENGAADIFEGTTYGSQFQFVISKNCETPERAVEFFDYLYTEEGAMLFKYGVEGVHYEFNPDGSVKGIGDASLENISKDENKIKTGIGVYGNFIPYDPPSVNKVNVELLREALLPVQLDFCDYYGIDLPIDKILQEIEQPYVNASTSSAISPESGSDVADKLAAINAFLPTGITRLVFQETDEDFRNEKVAFKEQIEALGLDDVTSFYITEFNRINDQMGLE